MAMFSRPWRRALVASDDDVSIFAILCTRRDVTNVNSTKRCEANLKTLRYIQGLNLIPLWPVSCVLKFIEQYNF